MAKSLASLIEDVYIELGMDHLPSKPFSRRMVGRVLNRGIGYLSKRGINGRWWQANAVTLTAGTTLYTYTPPAHVDAAALTTTVKSVAAARRTSDGQPVGVWTPARIKAMQMGDPKGAPEAIAFYLTGEDTTADAGNPNAWKVMVYPEPRSSDLPCKLDFLIATIQSMRFREFDTTWQVDYSDGAEMALVLVVAAELAARSEQLKSLAGGFTDRAEALISDEAQRQYDAQLAEDIVQVDG